MRTPTSRPIAVDLFAGAGGFSLGIEQAGFDVVVAVEKDPVHGAVHQFNFPETLVLCADAAELTGAAIWQQIHRILPDATELDLVVGGPPCQGFSSMGKRQGDDARNGLVFEFSRLVRELQPRYFVMENVPGLKQGQALQVLHARVCQLRLPDRGLPAREPGAHVDPGERGTGGRAGHHRASR
ncbi:MAG: DNA cytosine methyltransferase, partial [Kamptonema sp. SIO4C4]|nr:DNA cytosine methyltransferase [Kamptonema sp. SIO4C4]